MGPVAASAGAAEGAAAGVAESAAGAAETSYASFASEIEGPVQTATSTSQEATGDAGASTFGDDSYEDYAREVSGSGRTDTSRADRTSTGDAGYLSDSYESYAQAVSGGGTGGTAIGEPSASGTSYPDSSATMGWEVTDPAQSASGGEEGEAEATGKTGGGGDAERDGSTDEASETDEAGEAEEANAAQGAGGSGGPGGPTRTGGAEDEGADEEGGEEQVDATGETSDGEEASPEHAEPSSSQEVADAADRLGLHDFVDDPLSVDPAEIEEFGEMQGTPEDAAALLDHQATQAYEALGVDNVDLSDRPSSEELRERLDEATGEDYYQLEQALNVLEAQEARLTEAYGPAHTPPMVPEASSDDPSSILNRSPEDISGVSEEEAPYQQGSLDVIDRPDGTAERVAGETIYNEAVAHLEERGVSLTDSEKEALGDLITETLENLQQHEQYPRGPSNDFPYRVVATEDTVRLEFIGSGRQPLPEELTAREWYSASVRPWEGTIAPDKARSTTSGVGNGVSWTLDRAGEIHLPGGEVGFQWKVIDEGQHLISIDLPIDGE
jgi:hypothetical protein